MLMCELLALSSINHEMEECMSKDKEFEVTEEYLWNKFKAWTSQSAWLRYHLAMQKVEQRLFNRCLMFR